MHLFGEGINKTWGSMSTRRRFNVDTTMKQSLNSNLTTIKRRRSPAWGASTRIAEEQHPVTDD
jgi:hypothetical protein